MLLAAPCSAAAQSATAAAPREYRVLLAGNSLITTNNLPALLRAVGASQGTHDQHRNLCRARAARWPNAGTTATSRRPWRTRKFDVVVLQEMGGKLAACLATSDSRKAPCAASVRAYSDVAALAQANGAKTFVFTTWGPDERWQGRLNRSARMIAGKASATVFNAAGAVNGACARRIRTPTSFPMASTRAPALR